MKLIKYLKPYWFFALLAPTFMVAEVVVDLFQPALMAKIVNIGVLGSDINYIIKTGIAMLILVIIGGLTGGGAAVFASAASQSFGNDLRKDVFSRVMSLSLEQTDDFTTGSLITRLTNDITAVQELVAMALRMFVRAPIMFAGGIIMALRLNTNFALVIACALPIQMVILWLLLTKANPLFSMVQKRLDKVNSVVQENVTGARVVKAYVREDYETQRFGDANNNLMQTALKVQRVMAFLGPALMIVMNLSIVAIIVIGGFEVQAQKMGAGDIMAAITYITQILMSVMMVGMMFQSISRASASSKRIAEVLDTMPKVVDGNRIIGRGDGSVSFEGVSFSYPKSTGTGILENINLKVNSGETLAILGSTGAGKTSLVNLIPRFYDATDGIVMVDGVDVREYKLENLREKIGFVLQKSELFSGTIEENLRWGNEKASLEEIVEAAKIAQAHEFIIGFENGYQTIIGEKGSSLSGGQKQRLSITRAILKKPEILVFDDSTSALDLSTEAMLQKEMKQHLKGTTVIMIAQRVASVLNADKIAVLDGQNICHVDKHEKLLETCQVYREIYNSQMRNDSSSFNQIQQEVEVNG